MKIKGVIFDLDGTLIDSMWVWDQVDKDFLGARGLMCPWIIRRRSRHWDFMRPPVIPLTALD